jgi:hypothetical protein
VTCTTGAAEAVAVTEVVTEGLAVAELEIDVEMTEVMALLELETLEMLASYGSETSVIVAIGVFVAVAVEMKVDEHDSSVPLTVTVTVASLSSSLVGLAAVPVLVMVPVRVEGTVVAATVPARLELVIDVEIVVESSSTSSPLIFFVVTS